VNSEDESPRLGYLLQVTAVLGLSASGGLTVLFALVDIAEGARAAGLAVFTAVGLASSVELAREAIKALTRPPPPPPPPPPEGVHIYERRADAQRDIADALARQARLGAGLIITCGVSLREILHFGRWQHDGVSLLHVLSDELHKHNNIVTWDMLLLDPDSLEGDRRMIYEGTGQTTADIRTSVANYDQQFGALSKRIRLSLYCIRPFVFAVITQEVAFEQRYLSAPPHVPYFGCYGDLRPVLRFPAGSRRYEELLAELIDFRDKDCTLHVP